MRINDEIKTDEDDKQNLYKVKFGKKKINLNILKFYDYLLNFGKLFSFSF